MLDQEAEKPKDVVCDHFKALFDAMARGDFDAFDRLMDNAPPGIIKGAVGFDDRAEK